MNLVRLQYGGGGGELHGASITVNTEETTLVGKEVLLYKVSDLSTVINRTVFSDLSSDGVSTATFNNIIEPDTYIVKSSNGTEEGNTSNIEITSDDIINKTTLVRSLNLTLELNVTFYSASGETIKYKRQNSDELILLGKADNTGKGNGTIICKDGETITFSGDIAKDITTGTTAFSKDIIITDNTTEIKVMPDGAIYWYGNQCGGINIHGTSSAITRNLYSTTVEWNSNWPIDSYLVSDELIDTTGFTTLVITQCTDNSNNTKICLLDNNYSVIAQFNNSQVSYVNDANAQKKSIDISSYQGQYHIGLMGGAGKISLIGLTYLK